GTVIVVFLIAADHAMSWVPRAALVVYFVAGTGLLIGVTQIVLNFRSIRSGDIAPPMEPAEVKVEFRRTLEVTGWLLALAVGVYAIGFHITMAMFPLLYVRVYGGSWRTAVLLSVIAEVFVIAVFDSLLAVLWPKPLIFELLGIDYFV
ncbi:MAG TPA: hypothetical protein VLN73_05590, partial [Alphaproteobacteria bacterium]|nr:hypothetical protein [Alphaproteobacteria bacterium]